MSEFLKTPKTKTLLWVLCSILVVLIAFGLGIAVGYRRAIFASEFGENYYQNLYGSPFGRPMVGVTNRGPLTMHGVVGEVIDITSSTLSVKDPMGNEQSVLVVSGTPIREIDNNILMTDIRIGDGVTVIGDPSENGQVEARFIRVFAGTSTMPALGN
jgi:hypothetical protein